MKFVNSGVYYCFSDDEMQALRNDGFDYSAIFNTFTKDVYIDGKLYWVAPSADPVEIAELLEEDTTPPLVEGVAVNLDTAVYWSGRGFALM